MQAKQSRTYVVPVVNEKRSPAYEPPPNPQRELVKASLLVRPGLGEAPRR